MKSNNLGFFSLTMISVTLVIGMGIFRTPKDVAMVAQTPAIFFLAWTIGGLIALCGALTFAEIGSRYPVTGGYYRIYSYCYHPSIAFMLNCIILVSNAASVSAVALIGAEYISGFALPKEMQTDAANQVIALGEVLLFFGVNLLGLKTSSRTQNVLAVIKILMIVVLCAAVLFPRPEAQHIASNAPSAPHDFTGLLKALGLSLIAVCFTYGGYQQTINFGGETSNARKILPRSIAAGISLVIILYLSINFVYISVIGFENLPQTASIASVLAEAIFGTAGKNVLTLLLFFSVLAYVNVGLMSNPRVILAMSEEKLLPGSFGKKSSATKTPYVALSIFAAMSVLTLFFANAFSVVVNYIMFLDSIGLISAAATIFILRRRMAHLDKKEIYTIPLYPVLPIFFMLAYCGVTLSVIIKDANAALYGLLILIGFFPVYLVLKKFISRPAP